MVMYLSLNNKSTYINSIYQIFCIKNVDLIDSVSPNLRHLNLGSSRIPESGLDSVMEVIGSNCKLVSVCCVLKGF